jgi:hypothetical protein
MKNKSRQKGEARMGRFFSLSRPRRRRSSSLQTDTWRRSGRRPLARGSGKSTQAMRRAIPPTLPLRRMPTPLLRQFIDVRIYRVGGERTEDERKKVGLLLIITATPSNGTKVPRRDMTGPAPNLACPRRRERRRWDVIRPTRILRLLGKDIIGLSAPRHRIDKFKPIFCVTRPLSSSYWMNVYLCKGSFLTYVL